MAREQMNMVERDAPAAKRTGALELDRALGEPLPVQAQLLLTLQQSAGNRAVSDLVQRWGEGGDVALEQERPVHAGRASASDRGRTSVARARLPHALVQRFPTKASLLEKLGQPKPRSSKYRRVLKAVNAYIKYITNTTLDTRSATAQFGVAMNRIAKIETAAKAYQGLTGAKATHMVDILLPQVVAERALAAQTLLRVVTGQLKVGLSQSLGNAMLLSLPSATPVPLSEADVSGTDRGGTSEVTSFNMPGKQTGFFKESKETLTDLSAGGDPVRAANELSDKLEQEAKPGEDWKLKLNALENEFFLGVRLVGIDPTDARMANRDVAMARIDALLGADVIARARLAVRTMPGGVEEKGSIMDAAQGVQAAKLMGKGLMAPDAKKKKKLGQKAVSQQDPALMRLLSKLQLIDSICFQIDRNPKNFFIQTDSKGNVTGITGIDNDLALGTTTRFAQGAKRHQQLPGLSRYVDRELAERIRDLDPNLVQLVLSDLLSPAEIDALLTRLQTVQAHLGDKGTELLEPDKWTAAVAKGLTNEATSYWADLEVHKREKWE